MPRFHVVEKYKGTDKPFVFVADGNEIFRACESTHCYVWGFGWLGARVESAERTSAELQHELSTLRHGEDDE